MISYLYMKIRRLIIARRASQVLFMALFLYMLLPYSYSLSGVLPRDIFIKIDPLIQVFGSISGRTIFPGMAFALLMLILTLAFGRFFCGWICPLGAMIDLFSNIRKKRASLDAVRNRRMSLVKYYILGGMLLFSIFGISITWMLDPMTIAARFFVFGSIPMVLFACGSAFIVRRLWCRAVCPLGAIYALVARYSLLERNVGKCTACFRCKANCRMQAIKDEVAYIKDECILCMDCIYDCQSYETRFTWSLRAKKLIKFLLQRGQRT